MTTVVVWLLIGLSGTDYGGPRPSSVLIDRFASAAECERVRQIMTGSVVSGQRMLCVQATVAR